MIALGWAGQRSVRPRAGWLVAVGWSIQRQSPPPTGHRPPATGHRPPATRDLGWSVLPGLHRSSKIQQVSPAYQDW